MNPKTDRATNRERSPALGGPRGALRTLFVVTTFGLLPPQGGGDDGGREGIANARATLEKWVETRRILSAEERDWALDKETLLDRIELRREEGEALRARIGEAESSMAEADAKRAELLAENERYREASAALVDTAVTLENRTRALLARLPDPIRERVKPLSQRLPDDPLTTKLSLSERFQSLVGILNEVDKFDREITLSSEVRKLPDGTSAEVTSLYVGIAQGYYLGAGGAVAGVGSSGPDGWNWEPANEAAPRIAEAIAVLKNEAIAAFVKLPLEVR